MNGNDPPEPQSIEEALALIKSRPDDAALFQILGGLYLRAGHIKESVEALERSRELDPEDPFTHLHLGNALEACEKFEEALLRYQHAAKLLPDEAVAYWCQGSAHLELGQFVQANHTYEYAVQVDPDDGQARAKLAAWRAATAGTTTLTRKMIEAAHSKDLAATTVLLASRWLQSHPDDAYATFACADMLCKLMRYDESTHMFIAAAARFEKWRWVIFIELGHQLRHRGDFPAAETWYQKAIDVDSSNSAAYVFLGAVQARQGRLEEAEKTHRAATMLPDETADEAHHNLGLVLRGQGKLVEAAASFRRAIELCSDYPDAIEALQDVETARELETTPEALNAATDSLRKEIQTAHRNDQAATTVLLALRWLREHPDDIEVIHDYARMLYQMTRYDEAIRVYLDAADGNEDDRWGIYNQLGHLFLYRGDFATAETWYLKAIDEDPTESRSYDFLGEVQARQGKLDQAEKTHRTATMLPDGWVDLAYHELGLALRGQGRLVEAAVCFRKAIELDSEYPDAVEALQDVEAAIMLDGAAV